MSDVFTFKLDYPLTQEQIDVITDAELEHTSKIWFTTRSGKEVEFVKASQWIPCEERLPDYHDEVLVTSRGEVAIAWLYLDDNWRSNDMPEPMYKDILAWMPLPKAYEGRTE